MPLVTLDMEFGGLCLFVQRTEEPKGLYVLLPRLDRMGDQPGHCPTLVLYDATGFLTFPFLGQQLDLSGFARHGNPVPKPDWLADISTYAGSNVDKKWFAADPHGALAARVRLPLGTEMKPIGDAATMLVPPDYAEKRLYGRVRAVIGTSGDAGFRMSVLNAPRDDIEHPGTKYGHEKGDVAHHIAAYYNLLEQQDGPPVKMGDTLNKEPKHAQDHPCRDQPRRIKLNAVGVEYIDPYNCSVGYGE